MAPILIDNRGLIKLGLISVLTTVIVFAAGFLSGYQQATTFYAASSEIETLALPVQAALQESDVDPQLPDTVVAGAEIDVDQPQVESKTSVIESKNSISSNKEKVNKTNEASALYKRAAIEHASIEQMGKSNNKISDKNIVNKNNQLSIKGPSIKEPIKKAVASASFKNDSGKSAATKEPDFMVVASLTSTELSNIKYSIQVGLYGRLINAENMVKMLQAQHFDAYVSGYTSKKNENRYNVRFGYFVDKKSAISALNNYKNKHKGDGYLVNFSVENITKLADVMDLKQSTTTEETEKKLSPVTAPLEATGDKVSQAVAVSATTVLAGAQPQAMVEILPDVSVRAVTK